MRTCFSRFGLFVVAMVSTGSQADAFSYGHAHDVAAYSGDVVMISAPRIVRDGMMESNRMAAFFMEQEDFVVTTPLPVDTLGLPGRYNETRDFTGGEINSGKLNSYFLHVDSHPHKHLGFRVWPRRYSGRITFDNPILGLIGFADTLMDTRELQADATRYPSRRYHTHDLDPILGSPIGDTVWISHDRKTLSFDFLNWNRMDQLRIVTAVPEPTAMLLLAIAGVPLLLLRRCA